MSYAIKIYEAFKDEERKAAILAEAFEALESKYTDLNDIATNSQLKVTEIALQKEIKETELRLQKEIEGVRLEIKEVELRLQKEIEGVRLEIEDVRFEIKETELRLQKQISNLFKWSFAFWFTQIAAISGILIAFIKLLAG